VKIVRSDKGGENYEKYYEGGLHFDSFTRFLEKHGICAQYTMSGTPQQKGVS